MDFNEAQKLLHQRMSMDYLFALQITFSITGELIGKNVDTNDDVH